VQVVVLLVACQLTTCVQRCAQPRTSNRTSGVTELMLCADGGAAGGLSADDLHAALHSAEDEDDAAAAIKKPICDCLQCYAVLCAGGGAAGGLSADDLRAALRSAEDEDDAAAAAVAEKEAEAEMDEFTAEPPPEEAKDDDLEGLEGDDGPSRMGECSSTATVTLS
jgi:hypothetical protein